MTNENERVRVVVDNNPNENKNDKKKEEKDGPLEWIKTILLALLLAAVIKTFIMDATKVAGNSMLNTLHNDDMLFVNKIGKNFTDYERGNIIILKAPDYPNRLYVKRIIGIPGDTISLKDEKVFLNGEELNEKYTSVDYTLPVSEITEWTLADGEYFVMGDNRLEGASNDSRNFGPINKSEIVGHAFVRFYPFQDAGKIDNNPYGEDN